MFALISKDKTQLPPGAVVRLPATWQHCVEETAPWAGLPT